MNVIKMTVNKAGHKSAPLVRLDAHYVRAHASGVKFLMSKNKFRLLIISSLVLAILAGIYDYFWIDPISEQVANYAYEIEPELEGTQLIVIVVVGMLVIVFTIISFIGLLLFKSWAKPLYLAGFILFMPLYPFMGVTVYSGHKSDIL